MNNFRIFAENMSDMIRNPFIIMGDIPAPYFCDRKEESRKIIQMLTNGENVCLMSPRRMGKSKLVQFCYDMEPLKSEYYCFYIDIFHTTSLKEFAYTFGRQVFNTLKSKSEKMVLKFVQTLRSLSADFGFDPATGMPTFGLSLGDVRNPDFTLKEIFQALEQADKPCIVCFDEFQQIANYPEKNMEALLRGYIQHLGNAHFIFSGSSRHLLAEMFNSYKRPFYNSTTPLSLEPIKLESYTEFAVYWFKQFSKEIGPELIAQVYQVMESNTYYLQKTLHELFENTADGEVCGADKLPAVINGMIGEQSVNYRQMLSFVPDRQKELLFAIANEGQAKKIMGSQFIRRYSLPSASAVQSSVKKLLEMDFVTYYDGVYTVPDVLLRMFLKRIGGKE